MSSEKKWVDDDHYRVTSMLRPLGITSALATIDAPADEVPVYDPVTQTSIGDEATWKKFRQISMASSVTASATSNDADDDYTSDI